MRQKKHMTLAARRHAHVAVRLLWSVLATALTMLVVPAFAVMASAASPPELVVASGHPAAQLLDISPAAFSYSAQPPITMRGVNFPEPATTPQMQLVFLVQILDVSPFAACDVDPAGSSTSQLVCRNAPKFFPDEETGVLTARLRDLQVPIPLFVGVSAPTVRNLSHATTSSFLVFSKIQVHIGIYDAPSFRFVRELRPTRADLAATPPPGGRHWGIAFLATNIPPALWTRPSAAVMLALDDDATGAMRGGLACVYDPRPTSSDAARLVRAALPTTTAPYALCRVPYAISRGGSYNLTVVLHDSRVGVRRKSQWDVYRLDAAGDTYTVHLPVLVTSVSPLSVAGGGATVLLTIKGTGFSSVAGENVVEIGNTGTGALGGGQPCAIVASSTDTLVCSGTFAPETPRTNGQLFGGFLQQNVTDPANLPAKEFGTGDTLFPYQEFPQSWNISFDFTPRFSALYQFWCAASGSLAVYFAPSTLPGAAQTLLCSSAGAPYGSLFRFDPRVAAISEAKNLTAGVSYYVHVTLANPTPSDVARLFMTHTQPAGVTKRPQSTVPHTLLLRAKLPAAGSRTWFTVKLNTHYVDIPTPAALPLASCGDVSVVDHIKAVSDTAVGSVATLRLVTPIIQETFSDARLAGSSVCQWLLTFYPTGVVAGDLFTNFTVTSDNTTDVGAAVTVIRNGLNNTGDWLYHSIPSALLRASVDTTGIAGIGANTTTAVRVYVNTVLASTLGAVTLGSEPLWLGRTANTPTVDSVAPTQLATSGLALLIRGTFFALAPASLATVSLVYTQGSNRSFPCAVSSVTDTAIQCTVPLTLPGGTYRILVLVGLVGTAVGDPLYVTQGHQSVLASPSQGFAQGGTVMTITGVNFPIFTENVLAQVAGAPCIVTSSVATQIICVTTTVLANPTERPVTSTAISQTFYVRVNITQSALPSVVPALYANYGTFTAAVAPRYTYNAEFPVLHSVFPLEIPTTSGANITINGAALDTADMTVSLCQLAAGGVCVACVGTSPPSSSQLTCNVPSAPIGVYRVFAQTLSGQSNSNLTVTTVFTYTSVFPRKISPYGGVTLNLTGTGFPASLEDPAAGSMDVRIGPTACLLTDVQPTWIACYVPVIPLTGGTPLTAAFPRIAFRRLSLTLVAQQVCDDPESCSFNYSPAQALFDGTNDERIETMPVVPSFVPTRGLRGTVLTFCGLYFDPEPLPEELRISIGDVRCPVTKLSPDLLFFCNLDGNFAAGTVPVDIAWSDFGLLPTGPTFDTPPLGTTAVQLTPRFFTHLLAVDAVAPLAGSIGGGTFITIRGVGFMGEGFAVKLGDEACIIEPRSVPGTTANVTYIVCQTQALSSLVTTIAFLTVSSGQQQVVFPDPFIFNASKTVILSKATPLTGEAGTTISVTLRSFADPNALDNQTTILGLKIVDLLLPLTKVGSLTFTAILPTDVPLPGFNVPLLVQLDSGHSFLSQSTTLSIISYPAMSPIGAVALAPAGGTYVTLSGLRFARDAVSDHLQVEICGHRCDVSFANTTRIICAAPPLLNGDTMLLAPRVISRLVRPLLLTSFNENAPTTPVGTLTDGDVSTVYSVDRTQNIDLYVAIDVGVYLGAFLTAAAFYPVPGGESRLQHASVQFSVDGSVWTTIAALASVGPGWNYLSFKSQQVYAQYLRILAPDSAPSLALMEFTATGYHGARAATSFCPLIVRLQPPGSAEVTTCLLQPLLCSTLDASIRVVYQSGGAVFAVTSITPLFGPLTGTTSVTLFGAFPSVSTVDVTVMLDGMPCTVRTASSQAVTCETIPKPISVPSTGITQVAFRERGNANVPDAQRFRYATAWSNPASWAFLGFVPVDGTDVTIPVGVTIYLDVATPVLGSLTVLGALITVDSTLQLVLSAERILIAETGILSIGSALSPFSGLCRIVLTSPLVHTEPHPDYGFAFLAVEGGTLQLFSLPVSTSIVQLSEDANTGDSAVTVSTVATWAAGSQIAVTRSTNRGFSTEVDRSSIASYSIQGTTTTFRLSSSLRFDHKYCFDNATALDCSDEVILLSRSILVQGDGVNPVTSAHVVIRPNRDLSTQPTIAINFVEFDTVGSLVKAPNQALPGPAIHIYKYRGTALMTLNGISLHDSVYRGLYLDQCEGIVITSSVFFNIDGHAVATDPFGLSRFLTVTNNVASNIRARGGDALASGFYFTNPRVDLSGNVVSGSDYGGYFYDIANISAPNGWQGICPQSAPFGLFVSNTAHGCKIGLLVGPLWMGRTLECGPVSLVTNPVVPALIFQPAFYHNAMTHMHFEQIGAVTVTGGTFHDAGFASIAIDAILDGGYGAASVTVFNSYFAAHSVNVLAAAPGVPLLVYNASEGVYAFLGPRSNGLISSNNTFYGYETYGNVRRALLWSCFPCYRTPIGSIPYEGGGDGYTVVARSSYVLRATVGNPQGVLVLSPPYTDVLFDVDGTFSLTFLRNTSVFANVPHLSGLPWCQNVSASRFWLSDSQDSFDGQLMRCNTSFRFHHITVTTSVVLPGAASFVSVTSEFGQTNYTVVPPRIPAVAGGTPMGEVTVLVASGIVLDKLTPGLLLPVGVVYPAGISTSAGDLVLSFLRISRVVYTDAKTVVLSFGKLLGVYQTITAIPRTLAIAYSALNAPYPNPDDDVTTALPYYFATAAQQPSYTVATDLYGSLMLNPAASSVTAEQQRTTVFAVHLNACQDNVSCVVAASPEAERSYAWTDIRSWPKTGRVPVDGDDAVIPRGVTIRLRGATPRLHKLVVEGTLLFHTRMQCEIISNFVVVLGGTIAAGNSSVPHTTPLIVTLVADRSVPPLSIGESMRVRSGTLVNFGTVELHGQPKTATWTTLSAVLQPGTSTVVTSDLLDWNEGEEVVISSTTYDPHEAERGFIAASINTDRRGFLMNVNAEHVHSYYSISVTDSVKITTSAHVATLHRNIVIRNGTAFGCQVILGEYGNDSRFASSTTLSYVEIAGCGVPYINMSDIDDINLNAFGAYSSFDSNASVVVDAVAKKQTYIGFSVLHDSHGEGIAVRSSRSVVIADTVVVGTYGSSINFRGEAVTTDTGDSVADLASGQNSVSNTLVLNTYLPLQVRERPWLPAAVCSFESVGLVNIFTGNVAAGSESEGFCIRAGPCNSGQSPTNSANEAHSNTIGFFTAHEPGNSTTGCVVVDSVHAWKNSYMGIHSAINADSVVQQSLAHDNHISYHLGRMGSGTNRMSGNAVGGRSGVFDGESCAGTKCVAERIDGSCLERADYLGDGLDMTSGEIGILLDAFTTHTIPAAYARGKAYNAQFLLPATTVASVAPSALLVDATTFYYFYYGTDFGRCSGSFAVASNALQTLAIAPTAFSNSTWVVFNTDAQIYLSGVSAAWSSPLFCNNNPCDSLLHVLVNDLDGQLTTFLRPTTIMGAYAPQSTDCTLQRSWNAFHCRGLVVVRGNLFLRSLDQDQRPMEPLEVRNVNIGNIVMRSYQPPGCVGTPAQCRAFALTSSNPSFIANRRPTEFTVLISLATSWDLDLSTSTPPFNLEMSLGNCNAGSVGVAVVLNIAYPNFRELESEFAIWSYPGGKQFSMFGKSNGVRIPPGDKELSVLDAPTGRYFYDAQLMRLRVVARCGDTLEIHQLPIGTIQFYLDVPIYRFKLKEDAFLKRISRYLSIDSSRIIIFSTFQDLNRLIVGIRSLDGVNFDAVAAANEINSHITKLISQSGAVLTEALDVPIVTALSAKFAQVIEDPEAAPMLSIPMSINLIIAIAVLAAFIFAIMLLAQRQAYKFVLQYRDEREKRREEEDEELDLNAEVAQGATTQTVNQQLGDTPAKTIVMKSAGADRPFA